MAAARLPVCVRPAGGAGRRLTEPRMMAPGRRRPRHIRRSGLNSVGSRLWPSCQNWRMTASPGRSLAEDLSLELAACRKRGIERLDVASHNQSPVQRPELQCLADEYLAATGRRAPSRIAQLKYLFRDAITAFEAENDADAQIVRALFFGDSQHRVTKSAGELLDTARRKFGFDSEVRFRQARHDAFDNFADFLPRFVAAARQAGKPAVSDAPQDGPVPPQSPNDGAPVPELEQHVASTGYIDNGEHFITLLSQAENITIIGFTNETLATMLRSALARKRAAMLRPDGCWSSVRVVFLGDELLDLVSDERGYPDPVEARRLRRQLAVFGRRTVRVFLRGLPGRASWAIYDSPSFPPLIGTLFEMPEGRRIVQLLIRRRQRSASDHLFLELGDTRGHYFSAVFDEIVDNSIDDNKVVPAGVVVGERFRVTSTRYRRSVLLDGSGSRGWLAMVLVITWRMRDGHAEPLLQLRTQLNATRELDRLTHLAGHIMQDEPAVPGIQFGLDDEIPMAAARSRVQMETGEADLGELQSLATGRYIHPDKEHLFFFVYGCQLPEDLQLWDQAEMSPLSVQELLDIRKNQVLGKALSLCQVASLPRQVRGAAFEIAALNLILHDYADLAQKLTDAGAARTAEVGAIAAELADLEVRTRQTWPGFEQEVEVAGLSGLQFREFFTILLPYYVRVGVPGAAEHLMLVRDDVAKRKAVERLAGLYRDERILQLIPVEL
jgi:hypothetical protein